MGFARMDTPRCPHCRAALKPHEATGTSCPWCGKSWQPVPGGAGSAPQASSAPVSDTDPSFGRAMIVGAVAFTAWILLTQAWNFSAEKVGGMTFHFFFPAVVTGLIAR